MLITKLRYAVVMLFCGFGSNALAALVTVPPGLNPGDQYRLAFVTSNTRDALSTDIDVYNNFVTAQANLSSALQSLGTTWKAIGSTLTIDARDNTGTNPSSTGVPIYRLDGVKVANNNADLWDGDIAAPLIVDQQGNPFQSAQFVFTGTTQFGLISNSSQLGSNIVQVGSNGATTNWIDGALALATSERYYYAISDVLTVVPEPSTLLLVGIGTGAWTLLGTRRKRAFEGPSCR